MSRVDSSLLLGPRKVPCLRFDYPNRQFAQPVALYTSRRDGGYKPVGLDLPHTDIHVDYRQTPKPPNLAAKPNIFSISRKAAGKKIG